MRNFTQVERYHNIKLGMEIEADKMPKIALIMIFFLLHIPLAWLIKQNAFSSSLYEIIIVGIGLVWLMSRARDRKIVYICAYIASAEILWRATSSNLPWEFGKYAVILLFGLGLLKRGYLARAVKWPILYFLLLIPGIFLMPDFDRQVIAANLAGPLAMCVSIMYISTIELKENDIYQILVSLIGPAIGMGFLALSGILSAEDIFFGGSSITGAAGGFGANQVSAILALGALAAILISLNNKVSLIQRIIFTGLALWLIFQSAMTFSRGGLWTTLISLLASMYFLARNSKARTNLIVLSTLSALLVYYIIIPTLDNFTSNAFTRRFESLDSTGRLELALVDLRIFRENPLLGVGVGQSKYYHTVYFRYGSSHTEYTRLLAEHGVLGLCAVGLLFFCVFGQVRKKYPPYQKAFQAAMLFWPLLFMVQAATRLVAPSLILGLGFALFVSQDIPNSTSQ